MTGKRFRLAVLNSHPIQYFAPLYRVLNEHPDLDVTALYCSDFGLKGGHDPGFRQSVAWDVDLLEGYASVFLGGGRATHRAPKGFFSLVCPELWSALRDGRYDAVVIHGYGFAAYLLAMVAAKLLGIAVLVRTDTHVGVNRHGLKRRLRDRVVSLLYRRLDAFLAIGSENEKYYRSLGIPDRKIFRAPFAVDNTRFMTAARDARGQRGEIRRKFGISEASRLVVYASKFLRRKHPDQVIEAVARLRDEGLDVSLLMVGAGEQDDLLRRRVEAQGLKNVAFAGFVNQSQLPSIFSACDVFVLPSEDEPWGLVVNEAMCAGLPVVVSEGVGCVADLVVDGVNGAVCRAGDVESLVLALRRVVGDEAVRAAMGQECLRTIETWSYAETRQGFLDALQSVCAGRRSLGEPS